MPEKTENTAQQPETNVTTTEDSGAGNERKFSQEEVNKIVTERLARERAKGEPSPMDEREQALKARESRLDCRDYLNSEGLPSDLLDLLDTSDVEAFKKKVQQLNGIVGLPSKNRPIPHFTVPSWNNVKGDKIRDAFAPKK